MAYSRFVARERGPQTSHHSQSICRDTLTAASGSLGAGVGVKGGDLVLFGSDHKSPSFFFSLCSFLTYISIKPLARPEEVAAPERPTPHGEDTDIIRDFVSVSLAS